jgi:hypothetical protein
MESWNMGHVRCDHAQTCTLHHLKRQPATWCAKCSRFGGTSRLGQDHTACCDSPYALQQLHHLWATLQGAVYAANQSQAAFLDLRGWA